MARLDLMPGLTCGHSETLEQQIHSTHRGQAYFANTGPFGATCGECAFLGYYQQHRNKAGDVIKSTYHGGCEKFRRLTGDHGPVVPANAAAVAAGYPGLIAMGRPVFVLRVQAEPGVHVICSLRAWLKEGLRTFGLRCVSIEEATEEDKAMDMRKYAAGVIVPEDLRDGPRTEVIIGVTINEKHNCPVLEFESGDQLFAWPNIARALVRAYGWNSEGWIGHTVKLSPGSYVDRKTGEDKENIVLETVSSRDGGGDSGEPQRVDPAKLPAPVKKRTVADDLDDEIPY